MEKKICTMCGEELDEQDINSRIHLKHYINYPSKYDLSVLEFDLCTDCLDKTLDTILPMFKNSPLEDYEIYSEMRDGKPVNYIEKVSTHNKRVNKTNTNTSASSRDSTQSISNTDFNNRVLDLVNAGILKEYTPEMLDAIYELEGDS